MKKVKIFMFFAIIFSVFALIGCGEPAHTCNYHLATSFNCLQGGHVTYACDCGLTYDKDYSPASHDFGANNICSVCGLNLSGTSGLEYSLVGESYKVVSYSGSGDTVVIPYYHNGKVVTEIGDNCFKDSDISKIVLSSNIVAIGNDAFLNCDNLKTVEFEDFATYYFSIKFASAGANPLNAGQFFEGGEKLENPLSDTVRINSYSLSGVDFGEWLTIPSSVAFIEENAFFGATYDKVNYLGSFEDYNDIMFFDKTASPLYQKDVDLYFNGVLFDGVVGVNSLSDYVLCGYNGESLDLSGLKSVGNESIAYCKNLAEINNLDSLQSVESGFLAGCGKVAEVSFSSQFNTIKQNSFSGTSAKLDFTSTDITVIKGDTFSGYSGSGIVLPAGVVSLENYALRGINATMVDLQNAQRLGIGVFENSQIGSLYIGSSFQRVDRQIFEGGSLDSLYFDGNLEEWLSVISSWFDGAFYEANLQHLYLENGLLSGVLEIDYDVPSYAFAGLQDVTGLKLGNCDLGDYAFAGSGIAGELVLDNVIGEHCFDGCKNLEKVTINSGAIGDGAFYNCGNLKDFVCTVSQNGYYDDVFGSGTKITSASVVVNASNIIKSDNLINLTLLDSGSNDNLSTQNGFSGCSRLTKVVINGIESIGREVFKDCYNLISLEINGTVNSLASDAFLNCYKWVEIENNSNLTFVAGEGNAMYAKNVFSSLEGQSNISYVNGAYFYNDNSQIYLLGLDLGAEIPSDYNGGSFKVYDYAFYKNLDLGEITLSDSVTALGKSAFEGCLNLTDIVVGDSVTSVGDNCFVNCNESLVIKFRGSVDSATFGENWNDGKSVIYDYEGE